MKNTQWLDGIHQMDTVAPPLEAQGDVIYTLFLRDFLAMPEVNFSEGTKIDANLRSLLN